MKIIDYLKQSFLYYLASCIAIILLACGAVSLESNLTSTQFYLPEVWRYTFSVIFHPIFIVLIVLVSFSFYINSFKEKKVISSQRSSSIFKKILKIALITLLSLICMVVLIKILINFY
jgi:hypothetical protein